MRNRHHIYIYIYIQDHIGSLRVASVVLFRISLHVFGIMYLCVELVLAALHHPKIPSGERMFWYTLLRIRKPFCAIWDPFAAPRVARRRKRNNATLIFPKRVERGRSSEVDLNDVACSAKFDAQQRIIFLVLRTNVFEQTCEGFRHFSK